MENFIKKFKEEIISIVIVIASYNFIFYPVEIKGVALIFIRFALVLILIAIPMEIYSNKKKKKKDE